MTLKESVGITKLCAWIIITLLVTITVFKTAPLIVMSDDAENYRKHSVDLYKRLETAMTISWKSIQQWVKQASVNALLETSTTIEMIRSYLVIRRREIQMSWKNIQQWVKQASVDTLLETSTTIGVIKSYLVVGRREIQMSWKNIQQWVKQATVHALLKASATIGTIKSYLGIRRREKNNLNDEKLPKTIKTECVENSREP